MTPRVFAVDIGGTKVDYAWVAPNGDTEPLGRIETVEAGDNLFDAIVDVASRVQWHSDDVVGVGCGGPMTFGGERVSPLNIPAWRSFPLRAELSRALGRPVAVDNDAKALALAEGRFGSARHLSNFVAMVVSTGVGGGIVLDNRLLDGRDGNAGHIGHIVVNPNGARCACGVRGCLEAEASGTAISRQTGRPASEANEDIRRRTGQMVGRAVAATASLLDVVHFFVAGSVALGFGEPFFEAANEEARRLVGLDFAQTVTISPSGLSDRGPILGAACVAWRSLET